MRESAKKNRRKLELCSKRLRENCEQLNQIFQQVSGKRELMTRVWSTEFASLKIKQGNQIIKDYDAVNKSGSMSIRKPQLTELKQSCRTTKSHPLTTNQVNSFPLDASELFRNFKKTESQKSIETSLFYSEIPRKTVQNGTRNANLKDDIKLNPEEFKFDKTNKFLQVKDTLETKNKDPIKSNTDFPFVDLFLHLDDSESEDLTTKESPSAVCSKFKGSMFLSSRKISTGNSIFRFKSQNQIQENHQIQQFSITNPFEEDALLEKAKTDNKIFLGQKSCQKAELPNEETDKIGKDKWRKLNWRESC